MNAYYKKMKIPKTKWKKKNKNIPFSVLKLMNIRKYKFYKILKFAKFFHFPQHNVFFKNMILKKSILTHIFVLYCFIVLKIYNCGPISYSLFISIFNVLNKVLFTFHTSVHTYS